MKVRSRYTSAQNPASSPFHARKIRAPYNAYIDGYNLLPLLLPNSPPDSLSLLTYSIQITSLQSLQHARWVPASGPLHMLFPLSEMLFLQLLL